MNASPASTASNDVPVPRPFDAIMLDVGDGHWLYVEEVGTRGGVPAVFLHGGPGSGSQHAHRTLFDMDRHHAVLFDQRGAGRSHPYLSRDANTTAHLVDDLEKIRAHFAFEKWLVVGGSWGSTLALAYAQAHPERVLGLVLRAVFLGTKEEVAWAFVDGPKRFRPDLWDAFVSFLPEDERARPVSSYVERLLAAARETYAPAAHVWGAYERVLSEIEPQQVALPTSFPCDARVPPTAIMEAHYINNDFFLAPGQLLDNCSRLAGIPGVIVQGRYDLLCPPTAAYQVAQRWRDCRLQLVETAGHSWSDTGVADAMRAAIRKLSR